MSSDSSGGIVLSGDSLKISNQTVIDNGLNVNVSSVNANQYKIGGAQFVDNSLNLNINNVMGAKGVFNNGEFANIVSNVIDANQYKISGMPFVDGDLNLNVNSLRSNSLNTTNVNTTNVSSAMVNSDQYKINGSLFIDKDLNLNVNSLRVSTFNPDKIVTGMLTASSIVVSGKTVIDTNKNVNASNITSFNVDTSAISINGKPFVDKSRNVIANNVDTQTLSKNNKTLIDENGNFDVNSLMVNGNLFVDSSCNVPGIYKSMLNFLTLNRLSSYENLDLSNCDFSKRPYINVTFANTNLSGANFREANVAGSVFYNTNMTNVDMSGAIISGASFINVDSSGINMLGTIGVPKFPIGTKILQGINYTIYNGCYITTIVNSNGTTSTTVNYNFYKTATVISSGFVSTFADLENIVKGAQITSNKTLVANCVFFNPFAGTSYQLSFNAFPYGDIWYNSTDPSAGPPNILFESGNLSTTSTTFQGNGLINGISRGYYKIFLMYGIHSNMSAANLANKKFTFSIQQLMSITGPGLSDTSPPAIITSRPTSNDLIYRIV